MRVRPLRILVQGVRMLASQMAETSGLVPTPWSAQGHSQLGHQLRALTGTGASGSLRPLEGTLVQQLGGRPLSCRAERRQPRIARRVTTRRQADGGPVEGASSSGKGLTATTLREKQSSVAFPQELHSLAPADVSFTERKASLPDSVGAPSSVAQERQGTGGTVDVGHFVETRSTPSASVLDALPVQTSLPSNALLGESAEVLEEATEGDAEGRDSGLTEETALYKIPRTLLSESRKFKIKSAEFIKSSADVSQCPQDGRPEVAVIGRSNVGKSSIINMLTHRKELAQTSKKPGQWEEEDVAPLYHPHFILISGAPGSPNQLNTRALC